MILTPMQPAVAQAADAATNLPPLITHYGAIAYGQDGSQGTARRHLSKLGAQQQALQRCGDSTCTVVSTFTRCGAVAHDGARYHGGVGLSRPMAEANAISRLGGGWIVDWACN
jgi:hypothetical protein